MDSGSVAKGLLYGGFSSCVAETVTMPVDVVKTRLQMDGAGSANKLYNGSVDCALKLTKAEGTSALFKGLPPALLRQSTYGSLRYGLYGPMRDSLGVAPGTPKSEIPLWKKIVAGGGSGALASAVANPTDLVKVRLQTDGQLRGADGNFLPKKYTGMLHAFSSIVKEEGILGLWKGGGANLWPRHRARRRRARHLRRGQGPLPLIGPLEGGPPLHRLHRLCVGLRVHRRLVAVRRRQVARHGAASQPRRHGQALTAAWSTASSSRPSPRGQCRSTTAFGPTLAASSRASQSCSSSWSSSRRTLVSLRRAAPRACAWAGGYAPMCGAGGRRRGSDDESQRRLGCMNRRSTVERAAACADDEPHRYCTRYSLSYYAREHLRVNYEAWAPSTNSHRGVKFVPDVAAWPRGHMARRCALLRAAATRRVAALSQTRSFAS